MKFGRKLFNHLICPNWFSCSFHYTFSIMNFALMCLIYFSLDLFKNEFCPNVIDVVFTKPCSQ